MRTIYLILTFVCCIIAKAETFPYRSIASFNISPASESHCMILDSEGMMWVGTNSGLKSYDGYTVKSYKSNALSPGILPNNDIRSMAEDHEQNLWLGDKPEDWRFQDLFPAKRRSENHLPSLCFERWYTLGWYRWRIILFQSGK